MAARREAQTLRVFSPRLTKAIDGATGNTPAMFSTELVAKGFISVQGANNIIQVTANPPYKIISQLVLHAYSQVKEAHSDEEAQRLFERFLNILHDLDLEHLKNEIESYRGEGYNRADDPIDVKCAMCRDVLYQPVTLTCGHRFCRKCISQKMQQPDLIPQKFKCAYCSKIIDSQPMFFNQSTADCLNAYFKKNPGEEAKLEEKYRDQKVSEEEFCCQYETLIARPNKIHNYFS